MKLLLWGTADRGKPRVRLLLAALEQNPIEVQDIHRDVWGGLRDKSRMSFGRAVWQVFIWFSACPVLLWRFLRAPKPDVVLLSYPAQLDALILWPFARLRGVPIVMDIFISLYDTVVLDRKMVRRGGLAARLLWAFEWLSFRAADRLFIDTAPHARHIERLFRLPNGQIGAVPVGAEEQFQPSSKNHGHTRPLVLFYGQMIPLHGVSVVLDAALSEAGQAWDWVLVGEGQETSKLEDALKNNPPHITWHRWIDYTELTALIAKADICLGIFGTSEKAASVVPNKVYQCLAAGRHVITRRSPAMEDLLQGNDDPGVTLVIEDAPESLTSGIARALETGARAPSQALRDRFSTKAIALALTQQFPKP